MYLLAKAKLDDNITLRDNYKSYETKAAKKSSKVIKAIIKHLSKKNVYPRNVELTSKGNTFPSKYDYHGNIKFRKQSRVAKSLP